MVWMLSKFYADPVHGFKWPVAASYAYTHVCPRHPDTDDGWALVKCDSAFQQVEAAEQDPRVQPYRTTWDIITEQTQQAYASQGATAGMMLGQLLRTLAQIEPGYMGEGL